MTRRKALHEAVHAHVLFDLTYPSPEIVRLTEMPCGNSSVAHVALPPFALHTRRAAWRKHRDREIGRDVRHVRVASERMLFDWMKCGVSGARRLGCSLFWVWAWGMRPFLLLHWALYLDAYQMGAYGQEMGSERWQLRARSALAAQSTVVCCSLYSGSLARQILYLGVCCLKKTR